MTHVDSITLTFDDHEAFLQGWAQSEDWEDNYKELFLAIRGYVGDDAGHYDTSRDYVKNGDILHYRSFSEIVDFWKETKNDSH